MSIYQAYARQVFQIESQAIADLIQYLDAEFDRIIDFILKRKGKVIVCGVGKSGIIGKKIAATFASTGTPSLFLHPTEAFHGDLGMIQSEDVIILISYSGETEEILRLVPFFKKFKTPTIAITGNPESTLAQHSLFHLNIKVEKEACPLELAPTSSTTATLVMGDALAVALMYARNFRPEDFAKYHPGGSLGKRLLTTVESVMYRNNLPLVFPDAEMKEVIHTMTTGKLGIAVVCQKNNEYQQQICGIITDGDLRRAMDKYEADFFHLKAGDIMTISPKTILPETKMAEAEEIMTKFQITSLLVAKNEELIGIVQVYNVNL